MITKNRFTKNEKLWRIMFAIGAPLCVLNGAIYFYFRGSRLKCIVYDKLHIYCCGCGATRALEDLMRFRILEALDHNVFFVIALPFVCYYFFKEYVRIVTGKDIIPFVKIKLNTSIIILVIILLFGIVRNIPFYPFTILAP